MHNKNDNSTDETFNKKKSAIGGGELSSNQPTPEPTLEQMPDPTLGRIPGPKMNRRILVSASALALVFVAMESKLAWPESAQASPSAAGRAGLSSTTFTAASTAHAAQPETKSSISTTADAAIQNIDSTSLNRAFTTLALRTSPAVVSIYTKTLARQGGRGGLGSMPRMMPKSIPGMPPGFGSGQDDFEFFFGNPLGPHPGATIPEAQALGSGFVINDDGYIVTNAHVVSEAGHNADEIMVKFADDDTKGRGKGHRAEIVGVDSVDDVALLKLTDKKTALKFISFGDSDHSQVGEWVVAIGNPYGHSNSVTQGIVSAMGRDLDGTRTDFIQTSASINPGNSGGPLVNLNGEVIGINTAIDPRAQGIGFAIPINTVKGVIAQLMKSGHVDRAWLGIGIQDLNEEIVGYMRLKDTEGVLVKAIEPGQAAAKAGLQQYDVITKINDRPIANSKDVFRSMDQLAAGTSANVEVIRDQKKLMVKVELGQQPHSS